MKFCYLDESGMGTEPYAVMAGVIVDAHRMHITKADWNELLKVLTKIVEKEVKEIHTKDFYPGNGIWRGMSGEKRTRVIDAVFAWLQGRKHQVIITAVNKTKFFSEYSKETQYCQVESLWSFMALHITLSIQRYFQSQKGNKGNTIMIFDNKDTEEQKYNELMLNLPDWTDAYYSRKRKQETIDQIIDVPYFVDSEYVGLIQVADFVSFFVRKHIEIADGNRSPDYPDESSKLSKWFGEIKKLLIPSAHLHLKHGRCECAELFYKYAPDTIRNL